MRGGARVNSGPAPDPNALRRERPSDKDGWRTLPRVRTAPAPAWPLKPDLQLRAQLADTQASLADLEEQVQTCAAAKRGALGKKAGQARLLVRTLELRLLEQAEAEAELWVALWSTPQSHVWAELGWTREVAGYVRHRVYAENGSLKDAAEARQWSDRLGLNPAAMMRNRWRVAPDEVAEQRQSGPAAAGRQSAKDRLKVLGAAGS